MKPSITQSSAAERFLEPELYPEENDEIRDNHIIAGDNANANNNPINDLAKRNKVNAPQSISQILRHLTYHDSVDIESAQHASFRKGKVFE